MTPPDYRSDPMDSPEGKGKARAAWEAYVRTVNRHAPPPVKAYNRSIASKQVSELVGFWVMWHLYGGFEGMVERVGMHPTTVWRKVKKFRTTFKAHPDVFEMPGITIDPAAYWAAFDTASTDAGTDREG
jgi:hypothetical protein